MLKSTDNGFELCSDKKSIEQAKQSIRKRRYRQKKYNSMNKLELIKKNNDKRLTKLSRK